jgi:hypothetical protein
MGEEPVNDPMAAEMSVRETVLPSRKLVAVSL